jgi:DnaJ-domain-containing protein 1
MKEIDSQVGWGPFSRDEKGIRQREIYICTFAMLSKLVASDGDISRKELLLIDHLMRETLKMNDERRQFVTKVFNLARKSPTSFEEFARRYRVALKKKPQMYEWLIDVLLRISLADEVLAKEELDFLSSACNVLGVSEERFSEIRSRYAVKDGASYGVLGLSSSVSFEEVRERYEELLRSYDVERLIEGGFAEDLVELAQKKQAEITAAFLEIRKQNQ